jgi:hypothetical protein
MHQLHRSDSPGPKKNGDTAQTKISIYDAKMFIREKEETYPVPN